MQIKQKIAAYMPNICKKALHLQYIFTTIQKQKTETCQLMQEPSAWKL
jgi:hypothetical protein